MHAQALIAALQARHDALQSLIVQCRSATARARLIGAMLHTQARIGAAQRIEG